MATFSLTSASALFKTKYVKLSRDMYNSATEVLSRVKKNYDFVGDQALISVPTSFSGGVGSASLPTANVAAYNKMLITAKKMYSVVTVDRETIKAASTDEGSFVRATKEVVKRGVQSWMRNLSRALFNNSEASNINGAIGQFSGSQGGTATAPVVTVLTTGSCPWKLANFEPKDYINVNSLSTVWEIVSVDSTNKQITLSRISGTDDLTAIGAGTHTMYMQNSKAGDPVGIAGAVKATSGTLFNISVGYRWQSPSQIAAGGAGLTPDLLNQQCLDIKYAFGETPNLIVCSFVQYRKLLNQLEDQKRYMMVEGRENGPTGRFSFRALEFMSDAGPIPVVAERFVEDDTVYTLNDNYIEIHHRPDFGWAEDDGTVFLRDANADTYSARYIGYLQVVTFPTAHGVITGLAT